MNLRMMMMMMVVIVMKKSTMRRILRKRRMWRDCELRMWEEMVSLRLWSKRDKSR